MSQRKQPTRDRTRELVCAAEVRLAQGAAAAPGAEQLPEGTRAVDILAYTGEIVDVGFGPEVFDIAGLEVPTQKIPLLIDHDTARAAGFSTSIVTSETDLRVLGLVFVDEEDGSRVAKRSDKGYPQQASVRVTVLEDELVPAGETRQINGRTLAGPFTHDKRTRLKETSFVALGADANTRAVALAATKEKPMSTKRKAAAPAPVEEEIEEEIEETPTDPMAAEKARQQGIVAAVPDAKLALEHIAAGSTVEAAKSAYADVLAKSNGTLQAELTEAKAALAKARKASAPSTTQVAVLRPAGDDKGDREADDGAPSHGGTGPALAKFREKVRVACAGGLSRQAATLRVVKDHPDLHREVLAEANPGQPEPAYRAHWKKK